MAGLLSKAKKATINYFVEAAMGPFFEKVWPAIKYLIEKTVLIPLAAMGGIGYSVKLGYLTGPEAVWPFAIVAIVAIIIRLVSKYLEKKGESQ